MRVAALADVHGNAPALAAVLEEVEREVPDLVVFCGDLTWGSLPQETLALVRALETPPVSSAATRTGMRVGNGDFESRRGKVDGRGSTPPTTSPSSPASSRR